MKKILLLFLAILLSFSTTKGQDAMKIRLVGNNSVVTPFNSIKKITFNNDNLLLTTTNGTISSYLLDNIASITFIKGTGVEEFAETIDVNIFINSFGEITVETPHQILKLTVFDLTGREVAIGMQNRLNVNCLTTGIYILQITTAKGLVSKKFIKNK